MNNQKLPNVFWFGLKIIRYRIVSDNYSGFEAQKWRIYFPFWFEISTNTFSTIDDSINYIYNDYYYNLKPKKINNEIGKVIISS